MQASDLRKAVTSTLSTAAALGLAAQDAIVLSNSNKVILRLLPGDVLARVAPVADQSAQFEVDLASRLVGSPAAALEPRVEPRPYERDGFVITFWTYYEPGPPASPADFAQALHRLHAGMRDLDVPAPHFTDRVEEARRLLADRTLTPDLPDDERDLLSRVLDGAERLTGGPEQLLHGEPHPGNVLTTSDGPLFIDFETCCRGPVEFDLAHAPDEVADHYPGVDQGLLHQCRTLMLAMITTWRWDRDDQLPDGRRLAAEWLGRLRTLV